ncbi:MAG: hypothetical protein JST70_17405 [Bacteroidetes bacterium]|nr:hypothetical protein [Bacteroidota bacterium]
MKSFLSIVLAITPGLLYACNVCGGSANSQNLGVLPQFNKHFIGIQYLSKFFQSYEDIDHISGKSSSDHYQNLQIWGRYTISKRIQLYAFLPYSYNKSNHDGLPVIINGIGDLSMIANYRLIRADDCNPLWKHSLQLGGGIKLPTGNYIPVGGSEGLPNMLPGTGSWDVIANLNYSLQYGKTGLSIDGNYTMNTANNESYKFGNRLNVSILGYHTLVGKGYTLLPFAGIRIECYAKDFENYRKHWVDDMTGGKVVFATLGLQTFYKRIGFNVSASLPIVQVYSDNLVSAGLKAETGIQLLF